MKLTLTKKGDSSGEILYEGQSVVLSYDSESKDIIVDEQEYVLHIEDEDVPTIESDEMVGCILRKAAEKGIDGLDYQVVSKVLELEESFLKEKGVINSP
ncbi:hypothetical protein [Halonatronum saccharophilum]|uniref:hypothetical protein n=1 Tax=Halonatronum saccharophilum TaxID=150060 RepID=UPI0004875AAF|nr:hypothetical protein [Halonatronum saccharophilum]